MACRTMGKQLRSLTVVLGLYRFLGGFPYGWSASSGGTLELSPSVAGIVWTGVVLVGMTGMSLVSLILPYEGYSHNRIQEVLQHILNTYWYALLLVMYLYIVVYSRSLARILQRLGEVKVDMKRRIVGRDDAPMAVCILGSIVGSLCTFSYAGPEDFRGASWLVMLVADRFADVTIVVLLLLMYILVKIISLELEETVKSLRMPEARPWTVPTSELYRSDGWTDNVKGSVKDDARQRLRSDPLAPEITPKSPQKVPSSTDTKRSTATARTSPALHLLALDGITQEVVEYMGLPVSLLLLNAISASTVFLYNVITVGITYYGVYLSVLLCRSVQIILIPDPLLKKRKDCRRLLCCLTVNGNYGTTLTEMQRVEKVVDMGVEFNMCRLYTLDRGTLLTVRNPRVSSFVATYLVITLQFTVSEIPADTAFENSTSNS